MSERFLPARATAPHESAVRDRAAPDVKRPKLQPRYLAALAAILLLGAVIRWAYLPDLTDALSYDESYYASDAIGLLNHFIVTPFFHDNQGRESAWMYILAAMMAAIGRSVFTAHLAAMFAGVLSIAAVYRLGSELFNARIGVWAAFGMAVLYWPVHFSILALRVNLVPLLAALSLAWLLAAQRSDRQRVWAMAGISIAALTYSYIAARALIALEMLILCVWYWSHREQRRGIRLAAALAVALSLPMAIYFIAHPQDAVLRMNEAATISIGAFWGALQAWANAWFTRGDYTTLNNIPNRPILDIPTGALFIAGLAGMWFAARARPAAAGQGILRRYRSVWLLLALAGIFILPSLLSEYPPSFLRSLGLTAAIAVVLGVGADTIVRVLAALARRVRLTPRAAWALPAVALAVAGANTFYDLGARFIGDPAMAAPFESSTYRAVSALLQLPSASAPRQVYMTPYEMANPIIQTNLPRLGGYRVAAFDPANCLVIPTAPAVYVVTQMNTLNSLSASLTAWGAVSPLAASTQYSLLQLTPIDDISELDETPEVVFGGLFAVESSLPMTGAARPGDTVRVVLDMQALHAVHQTYSVFLHLYAVDASGAINDTRIWSQGDQQMCATYPTTMWQTDENIVQSFQLQIPGNAPDGNYALAMGVYNTGPNGARLNVTPAYSHEARNYTVLQRLEVNQ